jgi:hypothetical protein
MPINAFDNGSFEALFSSHCFKLKANEMSVIAMEMNSVVVRLRKGAGKPNVFMFFLPLSRRCQTLKCKDLAARSFNLPHTHLLASSSLMYVIRTFCCSL